jgi:hypothetical protein
MDKGTWTFRCRKCATAFELLLTEQDSANDLAKERRCPTCGLVPSDPAGREALDGERWHKVIGYRPEKNSRPFILPARRAESL